VRFWLIRFAGDTTNMQMPAELKVAVDPTIVARVSRLVHKTEQRSSSSAKSYGMAQGGSSEERMLGLLGDIFHSNNLDDLARVMCRDLPILVAGRSCSIFLKHCTHNKLMCFTVNGSQEVDLDYADGIPSKVLETGDPIKNDSKVSKEDNDDAFDKGAGSSFALPIICRNGERFGVLMLSEKIGAEAIHGFTLADDTAIRKVLPFCTTAIRNAQTFEQAVMEARWSNVLLGLAKNLFENLDSEDAVVAKIVANAAVLLKCEKCSVFMVDFDSNELYAKVFDVSTETIVDPTKSAGSSEIRFPNHVGIAGHVASTGEVLNIPNAYDDGRFNSEVDDKTGYKTKSILCMPIRGTGGKIVGVAQLINKKEGSFNSKDELLFDAFAIFCGLSLSAVSMYEAMKTAASRHKVVLDVLSYQVSASEEETEALCKAPVPTSRTLGLSKFAIDTLTLDDDQLLLSCIRMFADCGFIHHFRVPYRALCRWIITVRKNYRPVTYHNWQHAFGVAQAMFVIIKTGKLEKFISPLELMSMLIACICHDLDHRGTNNSFEGLKQSDLSKLYGTSTMERHHFDMFVMILNCDENNFMVNLSVEDYKSVITCVEKLILATDISVYLKNRKIYQELVEGRTFDWVNPTHRMLFQSMCMTASDLNSIVRPWHVQQATAEIVYAEFYEQGDMEREFGHAPGELFDVTKSENLPKMQVGFINFICMPVYESLAQHMEEFEPMRDNVKANLTHWESLKEDGKYKMSVAAEARGRQDSTHYSSTLLHNLQTSLPSAGRASLPFQRQSLGATPHNKKGRSIIRVEERTNGAEDGSLADEPACTPAAPASSTLPQKSAPRQPIKSSLCNIM
jgi:GTP-sensing pleiotropic transcriptional regulator CodY